MVDAGAVNGSWEGMPRKMRVEYAGAIYNMMSREDRREEIFLDEVARHDFWYLSAPAHRPKWMRVDRLTGEHGLRQDPAAARREFEKRMEARRSEESDPEEFKPLRRGWNLGSEQFREELLGRMEGKLGEHHCRELRRGTAEAKAARIMAEELKRLGWRKADLAKRPKGDPGELALAARLRWETTLSIKAIAAQAHLGTSKSANARLHRWMKLSAPEGQKTAEDRTDDTMG